MSFPNSRLDIGSHGTSDDDSGNTGPKTRGQRASVDQTFRGQTSSLLGLALSAELDSGNTHEFDADLAITVEEENLDAATVEGRCSAESEEDEEISGPLGYEPELLSPSVEDGSLGSGELEITAELAGLTPLERSSEGAAADCYRPLHKRRMSRWQLVLANARRHTNR